MTVIVDSSHPLGRLIAAVLAIGALRSLLFWQARRVIIRTTERNGIA
jgi:hypothetical protein